MTHMRELDKRLEESGLEIYAAEFILNGEKVLSSVPHCGRRPVYSVTKSVLSAAFAVACDEGIVSPEMPLYEFLEEKNRGRFLRSFRHIPFSRFLTMTAGEYPFRPEGENWLKSIALLDADYSDTGFHYSNIPAYLVGAALENAVGGDLIGYMQKRLFEPLDIPKPIYRTSPEGHFYGATGMEFTAHELAKLGLLLVQKGEWNGTRLISEEAVNRAVTPYVRTDRGDSYGFFFRIDEDCFSMVGKWGQRCMVFPKERAVCAYLSYNPRIEDDIDTLMINYSRELVSGKIRP